MQKKQSKNSRENISETWKMWQDKNTKKECLEEENCQGDLWQENYLDGQIKGTTKNTREGWKGIGDNGKGDNTKEEKSWKQSKKRKKKSIRKIQELENGQKKTMKR